MKKLLITFCIVALLPLTIKAQDARNRVTSTIIADGLAQLPAPNEKVYNEVMGEMAATGAEGIAELGGMLVPAEEGKNAIVEYALNGVVDYVSAEDKAELKEGVRLGLVSALENCTDNPNRAFLMTLLQMTASEENIPVFLEYISDDYLADWAANGLISIPNTETQLLNIMRQDAAPHIVMANGAEIKKMKEAEPILISWLKKADDKEKAAIYRALSRCGTKLSLRPLGEAAKKVGYADDETKATDAYLILLNTLVENGEGAEAAKEAERLIKATELSNVKGAALQVLFATNKNKAETYFMEAMNSTDREYRGAALRDAEGYADEALYASLGKLLTENGNNETKVDILNWFGTMGATSQIGNVVACIGFTDDDVAQAAIKASGEIGGSDALNALIKELNGQHADVALTALLSFNGDIKPAVLQALDGDKTTQINALKLVEARHITAASDKVFALLSSPDNDISLSAYKALPEVVGQEDLPRLSSLLENATAAQAPMVQEAIKKSILTLPKDSQYTTIMPYVEQSKNVALYYPILAQVGTTPAIEKIMEGYPTHKDETLSALLEVENVEMIDKLYDIATDNKENAQAIWLRYNALVASSDYTPVRKYQLYRKALEATDDEKVENALITSLGDTYTYPSLVCVEKYLDKPATARSAAYAVRSIVSKNTDDFGGEPVRQALEKAKTFLSTQSDADAGYAIDDINGMLGNLPSAAFEPISDAQEQKNKTTTTLNKDYENFELLLEWQGEGELGVRSMPAIALGGEFSGAVFSNKEGNNEPEAKADNAQGEWNSAYVKVVNDRVTIDVNGVETAKNVILENATDPSQPISSTGKIMFINTGKPFEIRDIYIRELPSTPRFVLSPEEEAEGFEVLFDGTSMHKWMGNTTDYVPIDGTIYVTAKYGGDGNLYTTKEYSDFILRFDFCYEKEGVNNGVGIRTSEGVDAAYEGMEIQILDHDAPIYKGLHEYQVHGSVYGVIPAKRIVFPPLGEWNHEEIVADGNHIKVTVNGDVILDGDIYEACQGHNVSEDGSDKNPYTVDHLNHPGLFNKSGLVSFCGHGEGIKFKNIRIKELNR